MSELCSCIIAQVLCKTEYLQKFLRGEGVLCLELEGVSCLELEGVSCLELEGGGGVTVGGGYFHSCQPQNNYGEVDVGEGFLITVCQSSELDCS